MLKIIISTALLLLGYSTFAQSWGQAQECQNNANNSFNNNDLKAATFRYRTAGGECTGTLLNRNTPENSIGQYFLTSWHCLNDLSLNANNEFQATLTFNYQSPNANNLGTPLNNRGIFPGQSTLPDNNRFRYWLPSQIRLIEKTSMAQGDMAICQILAPIPPHFNVYYSGWSPNQYLFANLVPFSTFHHERGDIKKITSTTLPIYGHANPVALNCQTVTNVIDFLFGWLWKRKWTTQVVCNYVDWPMMTVNWTSGNTLPGSSGASLTRNDTRIVGNLSTGWIGLSCNSVIRRDNFGKFSNYYNRQSVKNLLNPPNKWGIDQNGIPGRKINCYTNLLNLRGIYFPTNEYNQYISSQTLSAQNNITTELGQELRIVSNANFVFNAGNSITLNPGFNIEPGATFRAQIAGCTVNNATYRTVNKVEESPAIEEYGTPDFNKILDSIKLPHNKVFDINKYALKISKSDSISDIFLDTKVFPNPAKGFIQVNTYFKSKASNISITIYDLNGRLLVNQNYSNLYLLNVFINTAKFSNGLYNVLINADNKIISKRIVIVN